MYRLLSFVVLLLASHCALAMPDHPASMLMSGELSHEVDMHNDTAVNNNTATTTSSAEDDDDDNAEDDANDNEDDDDDEIHVEGKSSSCPARQPEIVEIEKQCMTETKEMKMKTKTGCMTPPTKDILIIEKPAPNSATIRLETVPDSSSTEETTDSPGHKHHEHESHYYHCILKKLDLLTEAEVPSKTKMEAWVTTNITDAIQREQTQEQVNHCLSQLKDKIEGTESSTESTEETEQSTESSSKKQVWLKCDTSKTLVCCLHHVECPVIQYP